MDAELVVKIVSTLAWPLTVILVVVMLREQIAGILMRIREVEGPGDFKIRLDQAAIKKLIENGQQAKCHFHRK